MGYEQPKFTASRNLPKRAPDRMCSNDLFMQISFGSITPIIK